LLTAGASTPRAPLDAPAVTMSFSFTDPATPGVYTLSLHDALPILGRCQPLTRNQHPVPPVPLPTKWTCMSMGLPALGLVSDTAADRKSTRLNSSHVSISYAVFCLKKKKTNIITCTLLTSNPVRSRA